MTKKSNEHSESLSRRNAIGVMVGAGAALAFGCNAPSSGVAGGDLATGTGTDLATGAGNDLANAAGSDFSSSRAGDAASSGDLPSAASADSGTCAVTPEGEIGPYFSDDSASGFNRSNILTNIDGTSSQTGVSLTLTVTVVDVENACAPYANAQVDIWHCNASGVYSDQSSENTTTETWLRGYQLTNASGQVTFTTIIPGWYSGRTNHIHLRVRSKYSTASSTSDGTNTTQLFFTQTFIDTLSTSVSPYSAEGKNPTTNAGDHVYNGETNGANVLSLAGNNTNGYSASITIGLPITAS